MSTPTCSATAAARLCLFFCLLCWTAATWAAEIEVTAELRPAAFALDQEAELRITVTGASSAEPELPAAKGLRFRSLGQSSQAMWSNGTSSASVIFSFAVQADQPGEHTIGPVKVTAGGVTKTTQPLRCSVSPAQGGGAAELADEDIGFLRILPEQERFYAGQLVPFTVKAYFRPGKRIHLKTDPRLTGENFLLNSLDAEPAQRQEAHDGQPFIVLTWHGTLSAIKDGPAALSAQVEADLLVPEPRPGGSLFDDPFFGDFFDRHTRKEIRLASPEQTVTVLPLPLKNRPADFKGAVGLFSLAVAASPAEVRLGDPVTLKMKIAGKGNFDRVQAPDLTDSAGWKVYPASARLRELPGGKGEKSFEQAVVPVSPGLTAVPPLRFSFFDPAAGDYVTLTSEPVPLRLQQADKPDAPPPVQPPPLKRKSPAAPKLNKHVVLADELVWQIEPLYSKSWFRLLLAGAGGCLAAGLLLDLRRRHEEDHPGLVRRRQAEQRLARLFREMRQSAAAQEQERFRQCCQEAVRIWAGAVWELVPEAVTLADLQERLPADSPVLALFARLERSGYAGEPLERAEMEAMLRTARQELAQLA
ncbi:MAG: BatD family protein [Candidatus Electronema sp. V4]|uniref:BatD family protein n=1 Tax=Candidatus Electronema sp. V4 TaxID=3454756 RepID=UPI00405537D7